MVLSVEDNEVSQMVLRRLLEPLGFHVKCAWTGEEALTFLAETDVLPDIILLDLMMPGLSGTEARARALPLRALPCPARPAPALERAPLVRRAA